MMSRHPGPEKDPWVAQTSVHRRWLSQRWTIFPNLEDPWRQMDLVSMQRVEKEALRARTTIYGSPQHRLDVMIARGLHSRKYIEP